MMVKRKFFPRFRVGNSSCYIGHSEPCFIVAEAGVNHNGSLSVARKLIDAAHRSGADAIKFQTFVTERLVSRLLSRKQFDMLRKLELSEDAFVELEHYAERKGIIFFSTPFDESSVKMLQNIGVPLYKIGSGDICNIPLLNIVAKTGKPLILSTGMSTMTEIARAVNAIAPLCRKLVLTHCTSLYPAKIEESNLRAMATLTDAFGAPVGYSDHTPGHDVSVAAAAMGACLLEKHLTIDKKMEGPDHKASLDPSEFRSMVARIRNVEQALGAAQKKPVPREKAMRAYARRSITATSDIRAGARIDQENVGILRPGNGIGPVHLGKIIGKTARRNIRNGEQIKWSMLQ